MLQTGQNPVFGKTLTTTKLAFSWQLHFSFQQKPLPFVTAAPLSFEMPLCYNSRIIRNKKRCVPIFILAHRYGICKTF